MLSTYIEPFTSNVALGEIVPIPTFPEAFNIIPSVAVPDTVLSIFNESASWSKNIPAPIFVVPWS